MFVVSRVFTFLGVGKSLFVHPVIALVGYLLMIRAPSVRLMGIVKVADNAVDYSLGNTTKQTLWLNTSRESKYKAKQAVDSFFVRAGDVIQGAFGVHGRAPGVYGSSFRRRERCADRVVAVRGGAAERLDYAQAADTRRRDKGDRCRNCIVASSCSG
jgi:hypothetical protein